MVKIATVYEGNLRCRAIHEPSGTALQTDAPRDNQGNGEFFSPTDLVASALGTCILTTMGILARRLNVDMQQASASVGKEMVASPIRRIGRLTVDIHMPGSIATEHRLQLEHAAHACPVHRSLHPDMEIPIRFHWEGDSP